MLCLVRHMMESECTLLKNSVALAAEGARAAREQLRAASNLSQPIGGVDEVRRSCSSGFRAPGREPGIREAPGCKARAS